jgi:hypothetical protein
MIHVKAYLETKKTTKGVHILIGGFMDPVLSPFFNIWDPENQTLRYWGEGDEPFEGTSIDALPFVFARCFCYQENISFKENKKRPLMMT